MPERQQIADALAAKAREVAFGGKLLEPDVVLIDKLADSLFSRFPAAAAAPLPDVGTATPNPLLTVRAAHELVHHEAIVREMYYDSAKPPVATWAIGITAASGHKVLQYKDNPQSIEMCLRIYIWLLRRVYIPEVMRATAGMHLTEQQFAALVSFHYNTGAILKTDLIKLLRAGNPQAARKFWTSHYLNGGDLQSRRDKEARLFFDGVWDGDGRTATVLGVKKPSYTPDWGSAKKVDIAADLVRALAA